MDQTLIKLLSKITKEEETTAEKGTIDENIYDFSKQNTVRLKTLIRNKEIGIRPHTRFAPFPMHNHDYVEAIYVCKGSLTHHIENQTLFMNEGTLLFLNKSIIHSIDLASGNDVGINFLLSDDFIYHLIPRLDKESIVTQFLMRSVGLLGNQKPEFLLYAVGDCIPIQNMLSNLVYALSAEHHNNPTIVPDNFSLLISYLTLYDEALVNSSIYQNEEDMLRIYVKEYISHNYRTASLKELAHKTGYSEGFLSRKIKRLFGKSFVVLLQDKRLLTAEELLLNTDMSVSEIIHTVGYENRSHFTLRFKEKNGDTPLSWKRKQNTH